MANDLLDAQPSASLCELFFESEEPDERDALFDLLSHREDSVSLAFTAAVMQQDDDPYLRVAAARARLNQGQDRDQAWDCLRATMQDASDEVLFEEALEALVASDGPRIYDDLFAITLNADCDTTQRRLACVGMERANAPLALKDLRQKLSDVQIWRTWPHDVLAHGVAVLVRSAAPEDEALLARLISLLPGQPWPDADDAQALYDLLAEAEALIEAQKIEEAQAQSSLSPS